jgi:hypothetical protein
MTTHEYRDQEDGVATVAERPEIGDEVTPAVEEPQIDHRDSVVQEPVPTADEHESSSDTGLFAENDVADLRARWAGVQAAFVDDPKDCVQQADHLVSDLVDRLTTGFAQARSRLEQEWSHGREASTEDLRMALMHYREFFDRLLGV